MRLSGEVKAFGSYGRGGKAISFQPGVFCGCFQLDFEYEDEPGAIDMCKAVDRRYKEKEVTGAIKAFRHDGASDQTIILKVMKLYNVTREFLALLTPKQA